MSGKRQPADQVVRARALDPHTSFLVQAPAGSGKTELLIQRLLRLLAVVDQPEEILAITFTRKAAAEMRERVLAALGRARRGEEPDEEHLRVGYELALAVDGRDRELGWGLSDQPSRLRIGTIDSVNAWLTGRTPLSSGLQGLHRVTERPQALYREAARQTLALAAERDAAGAAVREFLRHCDNRAELAVALLENMLTRRDQWLRHTGTGEVDDDARASLEGAVGQLIDAALVRAHDCLPTTVRTELAEMLAYAGGNLAAAGKTSELTLWAHRQHLPPPEHDAVALWRGLAQALLTGGGQWRRPGGLNVASGFPKEEPAQKARMGALLEQLAGEEELADCLRQVRGLPDPHYSDAQWQSLKAILRVLPLAAAVLQQVFDARGETDFTQLAANALAGLGAGDEPGELSLVLDYSLRHVLLDEYQDTSRSQHELLCRLTAGWERGDGRTLFFVGDPMQSIYRFREAEVGIFLETRTAGVNDLPLEFLRLETNFRSAPALVDWVNANFAKILPTAEDAVTGAVPLATSRAHRSGSADAGVQWHVFPADDRDAEAATIARIVSERLAERSEETIGILVRSRAHAGRIGPRLRAAGIGYSAPDLEWLDEEPVVQDLLGLTRALVHPADRIAWLAALRAPWCGLTLVDLHALASANSTTSVCRLLEDPDRLRTLSADGQARVARFLRVLRPWLRRRGAAPLRDVVEGAWHNLGGPGCLRQADELEIAAEFFAFLDEVDQGGDCPEVSELLDGLAERPVVRAAEQDLRVQIMTMHKAKGLEFDTVLLPALGARTRVSRKPLLLWHELMEGSAGPQLVLAPLQARGDDKSPLYEALWRLEQQREAFEQQRLLYVATTRARRQLHLFACMEEGATPEQHRPAAGSLLRALWPAVADGVARAPRLPAAPPAADGAPRWFEVPLRRLPAGWQSPADELVPDWGTAEAVESGGRADSPVSWQRLAGTVTHRWLQEIARAGAEGFDATAVGSLRGATLKQLQRLGLPVAERDLACDRVLQALERTLADERGTWLLSAEHKDARSEWSISRPGPAGQSTELRLDRSFVTRDGTRWIIDFKVTEPARGESLEAFLATETDRYRAQLADYKAAWSLLEPDGGPICTALYFPLLSHFEELRLEDPAGLK